MLLFARDRYRNDENNVIPLERVYEIVSSGCNIFINYDSGEMVEVNGILTKKVESLKIVLESVEEVEKVFRQFYKAANSNAGAFFFG